MYNFKLLFFKTDLYLNKKVFISLVLILLSMIS